MLHILRKQASAHIRGGAHGWARPDVPLQVPYVHKRKVDILDTNLWFYCNVMPEYFINQNELYLQNAGNAAKRFFIDGRYAIYALLAVIFMREFLYEKRMYGMAPDSFNKLNVTYSKKFICERPHMKKHFLNLNINGDQGLYQMKTGYVPHSVNYVAIYEQKRDQINAINQEGKAFIERVEAESRQKVLKRHGLVGGHGQGHSQEHGHEGGHSH